MMARWLKFNAAGIFGVFVQLGLLHLLTRFAGMHYMVATLLAVEATILHNFLWHEKYTWRIRTRLDPRSSLRRLAFFNLTNGAASLIGNLVLMKVLVGSFGLPVTAANLCAIGACSTLNFVIAECFVFAAKPQVNDGGLFI
jgi:dolichol-phosphate mannosyltransferase